MADINLKQYLSRLDQKLQEGAFDEALYHSRHILKHFPKNIAAYRVLGRALLEEGRWQQAGEVLRRVLSVEPDNFDAFVGLSQVYERLKRPDEAIWYLERAFEQRPNSEALTRKLRDLYAEHYKRQVDKINLTAGAVARQYKNNGLYDQALDVLQRNLQRYPNRADLRILMARVYREGERPIEAAEVAQDLLEQLPDCLEANVLLAKVWLAVDRPSDAQRHISRIEPVAPYVALEIVQGGVPDEDAFMLPELDYQAVASRELASNSPDWLNSIDESEEIEFISDSADDVAEADDDIGAWLRDDDSPTGLDEDDDWLSEVESIDTKVNELPTMPIPPPVVEKRERTGLTGLLSALESDEETPEEPEIVQPETLQDEDFDDLFDLDDVPSSALAEELKVDGIDLFADFGEDEETITGDAIDLFGDDFDLDGEEEDGDPMAWLQESGIEFIEDAEDEDTVSGAPVDAMQSLPSSDTADPMAWLKDSGVEIVEGSDDFDEFLNEVDELQDPENVADPMAWLKSSGVEILEDSSDEVDLFSDLDSGILKSTEVDDDADDEEDPMAWLKQSGVEVVDEEDDFVAPVSSGAPTIESSPEDELDWLADDDLLDEMLDIESFASEEGFVTGTLEDKFPQTTDDSTDSPDGQDVMSMTENEFPDDWFDDDSSEEWAGEEQPSDQAEVVSGLSADDLFGEEAEEVDELDWMSDGQDEAESFTMSEGQSTEDDEDMDEESSLDDVVEPALFGDTDTNPFRQFEIPTQNSLEEGDFDEEADLEMPGWLNEVSDEEETPDADNMAFTAIGADVNGDDLFNFDLGTDGLSDEGMEEDEDGVIETVGEKAADWLSSFNDDDADSNDEDEEGDLFGEVLADGSEMAEMPETDGSADEETPEWLMNNSPNFADSEGDEEEFSWELDADGEDEGAVEEGVPDWLASVGDGLEDDADDDSEEFEQDIVAFGMGDEADDEEADFMLEDDSEEDGMPDWLSGAAPVIDSEEDDEDAEEFEADIVAFGTSSELSEEDENDLFGWEDGEEEDAVEEGAPDWLSAVGNDSAEAAEESDDFENDFLDEDEDEEQEEFAEAGGVPDWLAGAAPMLDEDEDEDAEEFEADIVAFGAGDSAEDDEDAEFAWGSEAEAEPEQEGAPSWLSAVGEATEEQDDSEDFEEDFLELDDEEVAEADGVPDWLSSSAPILEGEEDEESFEENVIAFGAGDAVMEEEDDAFSWGDEQTSTVEEDAPAWLSAVGESVEDEEDAEDYYDDQELEEDVIAFGAGDLVADEEDEAFSWSGEAESAITEDAPDWLSAVGGDDESTEDDEYMDEEDLDGVVAFGAGDIAPAEEDEYEPVAFGAGDTVDQFGNEWDDEEADDDLSEAVPDWLASSAVEETDEPVEGYEEAYEEEYDNNVVSFGVGDTILQDAQEAGESLPLAEEPPLDDEYPVEEDDWQDQAVAYEAAQPDYYAEAVPLGDAMPLQEDEYTDSFMAAGVSNLLYEESRAGILDGPLQDFEPQSVEFGDAPAQSQSLNYDTIGEDDFVDESEEIEAAPADNAPDWLNTMVPGLDIDFEAAEDAPVETEFTDDFTAHRRGEVVMGGGAARSETDLEWLTDIVDDETGQPPTLPGTEAVASELTPDDDDDFEFEPEQPQRRPFTFSRPPLWLRRRSPAQTVQEVEDKPDDFDFDDDLDDMDEIGEDLPPWLDYDDDEF